MRTILLIIIGTVIAVSLQGIPQTYALSCGIPLFSESYEKHDLLLHGKLVEKNIVNFWENQKLTALTFETINVYTGKIDETFTIKANLFWDDYYIVGEEYVLFADKDENGYFRDDCTPNYIASPSIIKFLNDYSTENILLSDVTSLYDVVRGFERDELDMKINQYSNQNRENDAESGYIVMTSDSALTWFGALQILIILGIVGVVGFLIYRRIRK
jgi:hypothetical protein